MNIPRQLARFAVLLGLLSVAIACQRVRQTEAAGKEDVAAPTRDLSQDEAAGGHTLQRHVGRTDADLRERLQREPDISAASTYTNLQAAEMAVGTALQQAHSRVERWLDRRGHPNLVLDYRGNPGHPVGRTLHRGDPAPQPCWNAIVVLHWDSGRQYHVLTSYPECR